MKLTVFMDFSVNFIFRCCYLLSLEENDVSINRDIYRTAIC